MFTASAARENSLGKVTQHWHHMSGSWTWIATLCCISADLVLYCNYTACSVLIHPRQVWVGHHTGQGQTATDHQLCRANHWCDVVAVMSSLPVHHTLVTTCLISSPLAALHAKGMTQALPLLNSAVTQHTVSSSVYDFIFIFRISSCFVIFTLIAFHLLYSAVSAMEPGVDVIVCLCLAIII